MATFGCFAVATFVYIDDARRRLLRSPCQDKRHGTIKNGTINCRKVRRLLLPADSNVLLLVVGEAIDWWSRRRKKEAVTNLATA